MMRAKLMLRSALDDDDPMIIAIRLIMMTEVMPLMMVMTRRVITMKGHDDT